MTDYSCGYGDCPTRSLVSIISRGIIMKNTKTVVVALVAMAALTACKKGDVEKADTTTIPGVDTTAGMALPTTDTVVKTTLTDTIRGEVPRDSAKKKETTTKKP